MSILVTSDWHLNSKPRDRYRHDWQNQLRELVAKYKVVAIIMLGDLTDEFDNHPASLVNDVVNHLTQLAASPTVAHIYLMRGNHDYVDPGCPFFKFTSALPMVKWINNPEEHYIKGLGTVLFLPHTRDYKTDWVATRFDVVDFCFAHNTFDGTISESGQLLPGIPPLTIPPDLPVISGDIHKPQKVAHITYVGSPYTIDFGDDFEPRVILFEDGKRKSIPCTGPQKRLLVAANADATVKLLKNAGDDIIKLRVTVGSTEAQNWIAIKRSIVEDAAKLGVRLHSIEAVMDAKVVASKRRYKAGGKAKRDDQILEAYCSDRGVEGDLTATGLEFINSKG